MAWLQWVWMDADMLTYLKPCLKALILTEHYSVLVREKSLGREWNGFEVLDPRAGSAGPTRVSADQNSRVMLARPASVPHDLTRPVGFSPPSVDPTRPVRLEKKLTRPNPTREIRKSIYPA